jgi:acyl carrier protein
MINNIKNRVQKVLLTVFPNVSGEFKEEWGPDDIENWDSMTHLNIVMAIGEEFNVHLDFNEVMEIGTVSDVYKILNRKESDEINN